MNNLIIAAGLWIFIVWIVVVILAYSIALFYDVFR